MLRKKIAAAVLAVCSSGALAAGDDLAQLRAQIEELKKNYEQRIAALENKLAERSQRAAEPPLAPTPAAVPVQAGAAPAGGFNPETSLILQGRFASMKEERPIGGFWPAAGHDHGAAPRGFSLDHTELVVSANIDPFWRGQAVIALLDGQAEVEEAWFQRLGWGQGMGLKGGRFRSGIGYLNEQHPHQWDFADAPLMYRALFGREGSYVQDGVQFKWLAPTDLFLEFGAEAGRGANYPGSDRNKNGSGAGSLFAHVGGDVGYSHSWRAGLSYLRTSARERAAEAELSGGGPTEALFSGKSRTWVADFVWKWAPDGNAKYRNFKLQAEYFDRRETGGLACTATGGGCDDGGTDRIALGDFRTRQSGWYAQGVYQFLPQWRVGYRYERLNSGHIGADAALFGTLDAGNAFLSAYKPKRQALMADYSWSEFSRVRLQYAQDRSAAGVTDNQVILQYIMSLGAHGAHKF